jgi:AraC-like DNA-binding protein
MAHLAVRLSEQPVRVFDSADARAPSFSGHAVVGGPRSVFYVRDVAEPARSVGAQLQHGALCLLTFAPAHELAGRHIALEALFGSTIASLREQLQEAPSPDCALDVLEGLLAARLPNVRGVHPVVAHALARFSSTHDDVSEVVGESGYSHRRFITLFRESVGLTPKEYCRVIRFQRALAVTAARPQVSLAELAVTCGYSDQPHLSRDFRALAGISPGHYRKIRPSNPNHVPLAEGAGDSRSSEPGELHVFRRCSGADEELAIPGDRALAELLERACVP